MEMSVREARAKFSYVLDAVERGEQVIITKHGKPVAEMGPPKAQPVNGFTWEKLEAARKKLGLDKLPPDTRTEEEWFADFNDPELTRIMTEGPLFPDVER